MHERIVSTKEGGSTTERKHIRPSTVTMIDRCRTVNPRDAHISFKIFEGYSVNTLKEIVHLWHTGYDTKTIEEKTGVKQNLARDILDTLIVFQETKRKAYYTGKPKNLEKSAIKLCITCRHDFWTENRQQTHMCDGCKQENRSGLPEEGKAVQIQPHFVL